MKAFFCFLFAFLVSTNIFTTAFILEFTDGYIHRFLLTSDLTKSSEFSFTFSKATDCNVTKEFKFYFSLGSAKTGSTSDFYEVTTRDVPEGIELGVKASNSALNRANGNEFKITLKSESSIEFIIDGKAGWPSAAKIPVLNFDKFNSTHLAVVFYAWFDSQNNAERCPYNFDFPDYVEFKGETFLPTTPKPLPSQKNGTLISTTTPKEDEGNDEKEETKTSATVIYIAIGFGTLIIGILISGVASFFLLPKLSYFKPEENDVTKNDAEKSKLTTLKTTMPDQDEKQTKTISKAGINTTTKQKTMNGIPNIESYNG